MESSNGNRLGGDKLIAEMEKILNSSERRPSFVSGDDQENFDSSNLEVYKTPKEVLNYLDKLIKIRTNFAGQLRLLKYDIEDDESLYQVISKLEKAKETSALDEKDMGNLLSLLGVKGEVLDENIAGKKEEETSDFNVGDYVNWKLEKFKWDSPRKVTRVVSEEKSVFVEGLKSPIMLSDLEKTNVDTGEEKIFSENNEDQEDLTSSIKNAKSFEELYKILRQEGGIQGSREYIDDAEKIIRNLEYFRTIEDFNPDFITRSNGLRDKAEELKKQNKLSGEENPPKEPGFIDRIRMEREAEERKTESQEKKLESKPEDLPEKEVETEEQINEQLSKARSEYASALIEWKNEIRKKKGKWEKIKNDLGFEKSMPEGDKPQELLDAEKVYMEAKKKKVKNLFGKDEVREYEGKTNEVLSLKEGESFLFNSKILEQAEEEYRILQKNILENVPPLEKGIVTKAFEKWAKWPLPARVALSSLLMTGVGVAFGSVALGGAIATYAYRTTRSLTGATIGQVAGKAYGEVLKERGEKRAEEAGQEYGRDINIDNFEEKERKLAEFYEKEESQRKKDFLKKAGLMAIVGAGANIGLEFTTKGLMDVSGGMPKAGGNIPEGHSGAKISPEDLKVKPKVGQEINPKGVNIPESPKIINNVETRLSSRGFIQTFEDMKSKLKTQYPDEAKMPKGVKEFVETDNTKLAEKYGFYDPNKNLSGMGFKGETLSLDEKGDLHYNHLDGKSDVVDMSEHKFSGKMFKPEDLTESKTTPKSPGADLMPERQVETPDLQEPSDSIVNPNSEIESLRVEQQNTPPSIKNSFDLKIDSKQFHVDFVKDSINKPAIMVDNVKIAEQVPYPYGQNGNMMQLLDKYQDGKKYAPLRQVFVEAQNKELSFIKGSSKFVETQNVTSTPFESGQIDIVRGVGGDKNSVEVLLNGKKFAEGLLADKGPKVKIFSNLKGGIFFADTVYERAFKVASKTIKIMKIMK